MEVFVSVHFPFTLAHAASNLGFYFSPSTPNSLDVSNLSLLHFDGLLKKYIRVLLKVDLGNVVILISEALPEDSCVYPMLFKQEVIKHLT